MILIAALAFFAQTFEVATIKPAAADKSGRYIKMLGAHRFTAKSYTLKMLVQAAYNLSPQAVSGGPAWIDTDQFDVIAGTPGEVRPNLDGQMAMLRNLLADRFELKFHREPKTLPVYALTVSKGGLKIKETTAAPDALPELTNVLYPDHVFLPARNATIAQFVSMMQRAVLDRPVMDRTGLNGNRYDFDLEWTPDETQFGGHAPQGTADPPKPDLFAAFQQQLGLRLETTKAPVETLVVDHVSRPSEN